MKESKVKGKCWLPAYIVRNTKVQQIFHADKVKRCRGRRDYSISAEDMRRNLARIQDKAKAIEAQRSSALTEITKAVSQIKEASRVV